jgi:hypothetical protein
MQEQRTVVVIIVVAVVVVAVVPRDNASATCNGARGGTCNGEQ